MTLNLQQKCILLLADVTLCPACRGSLVHMLRLRPMGVSMENQCAKTIASCLMATNRLWKLPRLSILWREHQTAMKQYITRPIRWKQFQKMSISMVPTKLLMLVWIPNSSKQHPKRTQGSPKIGTLHPGGDQQIPKAKKMPLRATQGIPNRVVHPLSACHRDEDQWSGHQQA